MFHGKEYGMTTLESFRKFGIETRGFTGGILMGIGAATAALGLAVFIADRVFGTFGLEGVILLVFLLIFIGGGIVLLLSGLRLFRRDKKRVDGLREAYENHRCIMADIVGVQVNSSFEKSSDNMFTGVSYRNLYTVECHYKDPAGITHIYYKTLRYDPTGLIIARQVPVYIDRDDEENFFVDIDQALAPVEVHHG